MYSSEKTAVTPDEVREVIQAASVDPGFYSSYFFPNTCRQEGPSFHEAVWDSFERDANRYVSVEVYREGAKTTLARLLASKRIAYGISHFIVFVSKAEKHAIYSVDWLRRNIQTNRRWAQTFKLSLGKKAEKEIEIIHGVTGRTIRVVALGMTGQLRGFNVNDDRPDLIVADDPDDEETTGTPDQREKQRKLFFGALMRSLVASTENASATMILLQTPLDREDLIETTRKDRQWVTLRFGCFDERGESRWPARHPTKELLHEKQSYIDKNMLSIWKREMECEIIPTETRTFRAEWLQAWEVLPDGCTFWMGIDPASSEREDAAYQAVVVIARFQRKVFVVETAYAKGQRLDELFSEVFRLYLKWHPTQVAVEAISYQKVCAWYLREESKRRGIFLPVREVQDRRPKLARITDAVGFTASAGNLYVKADQHELIREFVDMPDPERFDVLDAAALAIHSSAGIVADASYGDLPAVLASTQHLPPLEYQPGAP